MCAVLLFFSEEIFPFENVNNYFYACHIARRLFCWKLKKNYVNFTMHVFLSETKDTGTSTHRTKNWTIACVQQQDNSQRETEREKTQKLPY